MDRDNTHELAVQSKDINEVEVPNTIRHFAPLVRRSGRQERKG